MKQPYTTRMRVRLADVDPQHHATSAAYVQFANQALWECVDAAGVDIPQMVGGGVGPVHLEMNVQFRSELRAGDDVDVTCELGFTGGKTYSVHCEIKVGDELAATVVSTVGMLDLRTRRLIDDPAGVWHRHAANPELLGRA